jgi:hypothetical protein
MQSIMSANVMTQSGQMTVWLPRLGGARCWHICDIQRL